MYLTINHTFSEIESWQNLWKSSGGCESSWNCGVRASRGVGVLLYDTDATVKEISSDDLGRILSCELVSYNKTPTPRDALTPQFQLLSHQP
jgi:hypothetical protein